MNIKNNKTTNQKNNLILYIKTSYKMTLYLHQKIQKLLLIVVLIVLIVFIIPLILMILDYSSRVLLLKKFQELKRNSFFKMKICKSFLEICYQCKTLQMIKKIRNKNFNLINSITLQFYNRKILHYKIKKQI